MKIKNNEKNRIIRNSLISLGILFLILLCCSFIFHFYYAIALAFLISGIVGISLFYFFYQQIEKSTDRMLKQTLRFNFLIRMLIYLVCLIALYFIFKQNKWVILASFGGYLIPKMVIIILFSQRNRGKSK